MGSRSSKNELVVGKSYKKTDVLPTPPDSAHLKVKDETNVEQNNKDEQYENNNLEDQDAYKGEPSEGTHPRNASSTAVQSDKTSDGSESIKDNVESETTQVTVPEINNITHEKQFAQKQTLDESNEGDSLYKNDSEENVDNSENTYENKISTDANKTEGDDLLLKKGGTDKGLSKVKRNVEANTDAKINAKQRVTTSEKQRETNSENSNPDTKYSDSGLNDNLKFYRGKIPSRPFPGCKICEMLKWKGDYSKLESNHSYIQWLFPIPESSGMNHSAQPLQNHEAEAIKNDEVLKNKVLRAFEMMLDFYGMKLQNKKTGQLERSQEWKTRYAHLNKSMHNYLRITRILKSLGELGWEHLQSPWLEFLMEEAADEQGLPRLANSSSVEYWIHAIKDESKQAEFFERFHKLRTGLTTVEPSENKKKDAGKPDKQNETQPPSNQQSSKSNHESFSKDTKSNETSPIDVEKNLRSF